MKILHVITSLQVGGAEHLMVDLLPRLKYKGNEVVLAVFKGGDTAFYRELESSGVTIKLLSRSHNVYNPLNLLNLIPIIKYYDVIHTHNTACQFYGALANWLTGNKKIMVTTEHNSTNRRRLIRWFKPLDKWMYNRYNAIICIANQTYDNLVSYIGKSGHITTIHNGVDVSRFIKPIGDVTGKNEFIITMVAAYRPQKDHETLLRAMTHLSVNYRLWIVGGGDRREGERIKSYCSHLGLDDRVDFMGVRQDVPEVLEKSDIVVLSSHWEGLSLSSIEGMACGRPFIASDVDGLHEIVDGAGVLFPQGDDKALADKIRYLCETPADYQDVAQKCQARARQYDISVMADRYLELYKSLSASIQKE